MPGHLFTPVHDEVRVIERPRFDVGSFSGCLDVVIIEFMANERLAGFGDLHWRRCNAAQDYLRVSHCALAIGLGIFKLDVGSNTQHWKIKRTSAPQFLIRRAPAIDRRQMNINQ